MLSWFAARVAAHQYNGAYGLSEPSFLKYVNRSHNVRSESVHRISQRRLRAGLGGAMDDDLRLHFGERVGQRVTIANVAKDRGHSAIENGRVEEVGPGRRREAVAAHVSAHEL